MLVDADSALWLLCCTCVTGSGPRMRTRRERKKPAWMTEDACEFNDDNDAPDDANESNSNNTKRHRHPSRAGKANTGVVMRTTGHKRLSPDTEDGEAVGSNAPPSPESYCSEMPAEPVRKSRRLHGLSSVRRSGPVRPGTGIRGSLGPAASLEIAAAGLLANPPLSGETGSVCMSGDSAAPRATARRQQAPARPQLTTRLAAALNMQQQPDCMDLDDETPSAVVVDAKRMPDVKLRLVVRMGDRIFEGELLKKHKTK